MEAQHVRPHSPIAECTRVAREIGPVREMAAGPDVDMLVLVFPRSVRWTYPDIGIAI